MDDPAGALQRALRSRILVLDGAMGTMLQRADLAPEDFGGADLEGCNEHLVLTRPELIQAVHEAYLAAGADIVETNTFGATPIVLAEYGLEDQTHEINVAAARLARAACDAYSTPDRPRFAAGAIGPTTKALTVTGGTTFEQLRAGYLVQARGLLQGGVDLLVVETAQDTLNMKAAGLALQEAFEEAGRKLPVILSATIEPTGTMLGGQTIDAWYTSIAHLEPLAVGMNCATGPAFMTDHLRTLAGIATCAVSVYPNAGLPDPDGTYPEGPDALAAHLARFVEEGWVNIVGGCCGTTPEHIDAIRRVVQGASPRRPRVAPEPAVAGVERVVIDPEVRPILVGERTNVIGSLRFKRLVGQGEWEKAAAIGRAQVRKGAQVVDVCLSHTDRDEVPDVDAFYPLLRRQVKAPLMIDSTDAAAIEAALRHSQGKAIVNSINLEDGEERLALVCPLLRRYGAAVVVGCIDEDPEQGMAVTVERKLAVAQRSYALLTEKYGIPAHDIVFDPLVFPCGTGDENYVGSAKHTVEGVRAIHAALPACSTILGISNVSFGLPEGGREILNSVFLHDCVEAGLTFAIVNTQGIERYPEIPEVERALSRDLLYDRRPDALDRFVAHFRGRKARASAEQRPEGPVDERLARYVVEGSKEWLDDDLTLLLEEGRPALDIINGPLMAGMARVGELFGKNELIVAEVLQSAEVMKAAVRRLEPHMESHQSSTKGKVLLATVKGDVHDIGKNLVEIILSNNGYEVVDLGIKVPPARLIAACTEERPDIIGLSGLLVKSAQQMAITAQDLHDAGIGVPLVVGGAALSRRFTSDRIAPAYQGPVVYARDAMGGLAIMDRLRLDPHAFQEEPPVPAPARPAAPVRAPAAPTPLSPTPPRPSPDPRRQEVVAPLHEVFDWINPKMLYGKHMGLRADPEKALADGDPRAKQLEALWQDLMAEASVRGWLRPRGVWRFFPASSQDETLHIHDPDDTTRILESFTFRRQDAPPHRCLSDYVRSTEGQLDSVALFCVTAGTAVREVSAQWREEGEYLRSHGIQALALEMAEGMAERVHRDIRAAWGIDAPLSKREVFRAAYQGCRYSFGYPACPDLEDQEKLWRLLDPTTIGVDLTEGHMMDPEASVSAIVFHHPEARYFAVSDPGDQQNRR